MWPRLLVVVAVLGSSGCFLEDLQGDDDGVVEQDPDIPSNAYCSPVANWDSGYADAEEEILRLVNIERARGANCGVEGNFPATHPLVMNGPLRCAARAHSKDMYDRSFFDHINPSNEGPFERIDKTGYNWRAAGENIAQGYPTPADVMTGWMSSDGHCSNIMTGVFEEIGVGYYDGANWTQTFGTRQ
jgi:uncharacterized protein YkwD